MPAPHRLPAHARLAIPALALVPLVAAGSATAVGTIGATSDDARAATRIVVAADGSGDATTAQEAVDMAPAGSAERVEIVFRPGVYPGRVVIDSSRTNLSFIGETGNPADVVITDDRAAGTPKPDGGTWGTSGSASVTISGAGFEARSVTFENAFDEAANPDIDGHQAVAVKTQADRLVFDDVRFLGNQDTLYLNSPSNDVPSRVYIHDSYVEGDVDFIFGRATAVVDDSVINALPRDSDPNGYVFAPSTSSSFERGFLLVDSEIVSDAPDGSYYLGRPWHPSSGPDNDPRVVVRDTTLGSYLKDDPWTTMSGYDWYEGSAAEYDNQGPGAIVNDDRPQLSDAEAADHEIDDYLAGDDGWAPQG